MNTIKLVAIQAKRDGRRGKMSFLVLVLDTSISSVEETVTFETRSEAMQLIEGLVERKGYVRVYAGELLSRCIPSENTNESKAIPSELLNQLHVVHETSKVQRAKLIQNMEIFQAKIEKGRVLLEEFKTLKRHYRKRSGK